ncbi:MAG TPA: GH92 family glycosyl hydrolase [Pelobium sp.]|nr:GH92 family glycosyl hydrolase [Pelobium sp.]
MMKTRYPYILCLGFVLLLLSAKKRDGDNNISPVDYVNPYLGNISHLLVPTFPTVHLPNSMLRVYPERHDFTADQINGLPLIVTSHRGSSAFNLSPYKNLKRGLESIKKYTYGLENITPYRYAVYLDEENIEVDFAPSHQSAIYKLKFPEEGENVLVINTRNGSLQIENNKISGHQVIDKGPTKVYLYMEFEQKPSEIGMVKNGKINNQVTLVQGKNQAIGVVFKEKEIGIRYGVSFISAQQAANNLKREIQTFNVNEVAETGKKIWNEALSKIEIEGNDENQKTVFYTSLYRTYERMINMSEDGKYYSGIDNQVHNDDGKPFYTDDWIWDTYRATHPLRVLIQEDMEKNMIQSYIRMAQQTKEGWMPTFPEVTGDSHRMNSNHAVAVIWDAYSKGLRGYDLEAAYNACKGALTEKSFFPWTRMPNTDVDVFYHKKGYFPALKIGETEYIKQVKKTEKRQPIAVTLGTSYDDWCLSQIAKELGKQEDYQRFLKSSYNYRNVYNPKTAFFHPKDSEGNFIEPFDYRFSGGMGARDYYGENNGWVYRWDVPHNPKDLINLMGSAQNFVNNLDQTFREPLGKSKFEFYAQLPDHTGNVGQFSMANEPSLHIPYLYNYAGQPWKTQKRISSLLKQWFRNDLMGLPGDEDGGGMSAFVVFSSMGFYPVTPGSPTYNIGTPMFKNVKLKLSGNKVFEIEAENYAKNNIYIQSAKLNGKDWNKPWFSQSDIANGGKLVLVMGNKANPNWGSDLNNAPPSAEPID